MSVLNDIKKAADDFKDHAKDAAHQTQAAVDEAARQAQTAADAAKGIADEAEAEAHRQISAIYQETQRKAEAAQKEFANNLVSLQRSVAAAAREAKNRITSAEKANAGALPSGSTPLELFFQTRSLTDEEITFARTVFEDSIEYNKVFLADDLGLGGRPWTFQGLISGNLLIHGGPKMFINAASTDNLGDGFPAVRAIFIHEMTHVWQGRNWHRPYGFMANAVFCMFTEDPLMDPKNPGLGAYFYQDKLGKDWREFHAEEQAELVEDWFGEGMITDDGRDPRWRYIRDNIRPGVD